MNKTSTVYLDTCWILTEDHRSRKHRNSRKHRRKHSEVCETCTAAGWIQSFMWEDKTPFHHRLQGFIYFLCASYYEFLTLSHWIAPCDSLDRSESCSWTDRCQVQSESLQPGKVLQLVSGLWKMCWHRCRADLWVRWAKQSQIKYFLYIMFSIQHHIHFHLYTVTLTIFI